MLFIDWAVYFRCAIPSMVRTEHPDQIRCRRSHATSLDQRRTGHPLHPGWPSSRNSDRRHRGDTSIRGHTTGASQKVRKALLRTIRALTKSPFPQDRPDILMREIEQDLDLILRIQDESRANLD